ncbi:MAG: response regulator [Desulfobacterales bacterium]|jgi:CheY-like chemotaxis protein/putative methionine-R-sulfoxide reductase with GAF domain
MKNVLFVDDEETLLLIMVDRFEDFKDRFNVLTAGNGKEAVDILNSKAIDLVVTDLKMPVMDGVELLAYMSANFPSIPAITVSAFCTPRIQKKLKAMGLLRVMEKPVNLDLLAEAVMEGLDRFHQGGSINCVSLSSFLQIIEMEQKSCLLEVHGEGHLRGHFYIVQGELHDASCGVLQKEEAAYAMIAWDKTQLYIKDLPKERPKRRIEKELMAIVMEGLKRKDEMIDKGALDAAEPTSTTENLEQSLMSELDRVLDGFEGEPAPSDSKQSATEQNTPKSQNAEETKFNTKIFDIMHAKQASSKLLRAAVNEIRGSIEIDLAVLMTKVGNKPDLVIEDLIVDGTTALRKGTVYSFKDTRISEVLGQKKPLIFNMNGEASPGIEKEMLASQGIQSCVCVPVLSEDGVNQVFILGAKKTGLFSDTTGYLDWIACGLSLAIERNRLSSAVVKQKKALQTVQRVGQAIVYGNCNIENVLGVIMNNIRQIINVEAGTLFLKENDHLRIAHAFNSKVNAVKKFRLKIGQGTAGYVAAKGKSILENDAKKSSQFFQEIDKLTGFKTRSVLCVPLLSHNNVIGVLEVLNKIDGYFDRADEAILLSLAESIILALMGSHRLNQMAQRAQG